MRKCAITSQVRGVYTRRSEMLRYIKSYNLFIRNDFILIFRTKHNPSIKFDFPVPFGPITHVFFRKGPIYVYLSPNDLKFLREILSKTN